MEGRNSNRTVAPTEGLRLPGWKLIAFIEDEDPWNFIECEALQYNVDRGHMCVQIFCSRIDHMQEEVGIAQFVQCRSEGCEEIFGQVANKPHRIGDDHFAALWKMQSPACRIERFENPWSRTYLTVR
jgi:hypothetical protein